MTDSLFAPEKEFGQVYRGKYHMPLLPGEQGTKSGGNWVPYGITRVTNLAGQEALLLAGKGKSWRYRKDLSDAQVRMARGLGIEVTEGMNRGTLSDRISEVMASRRIDPIVAMMKMTS